VSVRLLLAVSARPLAVPWPLALPQDLALPSSFRSIEVIVRPITCPIRGLVLLAPTTGLRWDCLVDCPGPLAGRSVGV